MTTKYFLIRFIHHLRISFQISSFSKKLEFFLLSTMLQLFLHLHGIYLSIMITSMPSNHSMLCELLNPCIMHLFSQWLKLFFVLALTAMFVISPVKTTLMLILYLISCLTNMITNFLINVSAHSLLPESSCQHDEGTAFECAQQADIFVPVSCSPVSFFFLTGHWSMSHIPLSSFDWGLYQKGVSYWSEGLHWFLYSPCHSSWSNSANSCSLHHLHFPIHRICTQIPHRCLTFPFQFLPWLWWEL